MGKEVQSNSQNVPKMVPNMSPNHQQEAGSGHSAWRLTSISDTMQEDWPVFLTQYKKKAQSGLTSISDTLPKARTDQYFWHTTQSQDWPVLLEGKHVQTLHTGLGAGRDTNNRQRCCPDVYDVGAGGHSPCLQQTCCKYHKNSNRHAVSITKTATDML